jgi:hypothetical protein
MDHQPQAQQGWQRDPRWASQRSEFGVPTKHMDDLVIEVSDYEHDPALFSGLVK